MGKRNSKASEPPNRLAVKKTHILLADVDGWLAELERLFRKRFPGRKLPYPPKEITEIAKFLGFTGHDRRKLLRFELRSLAYETLAKIELRDKITPGTLRKIIKRDIIGPAEKLREGLKRADHLGAQEAFALAYLSETAIDTDQLSRNLKKLVAWSEEAIATTYEPSVRKGKTETRQDFVDRLLDIYVNYSGKSPGRSPQSDQRGRWFNDSEFSRFVDICAQPLFRDLPNFDRQVRRAVSNHSEWLVAHDDWLEAGQKRLLKNPDFVHAIRSKIRPA